MTLRLQKETIKNSELWKYVMIYGALSWLLSVNPNLNYTAGCFNLPIQNIVASRSLFNNKGPQMVQCNKNLLIKEKNDVV